MTDISSALRAYDLGDAERKVLKDLRTSLADSMDAVLDVFYDYALKGSDNGRFFASDAVVAHARARQKEHWLMLLDGEFSDAYVRSAKVIGEVHFKIQLPFENYMSSYARAASELSKVAFKKLGSGLFGGTRARIDALTVMSRAMFLDAQVVIQSYFDVQSREQEAALDAIEHGLAAIADGRPVQPILGHEQGGSFPVRYDDLRVGFNQAVAALQAVNEQLVPLINSLGQSSQGVSSAIHELATRTDQQALAVANTVDALQGLDGMVKSSAESAERVDKEAQVASADARKAGEVVQYAVEAMNAIEESSKSIAQRVSSIEEVAFQTNLLALNAGVEAARAGEAGRGFAIVATEVRQLAVRASDTASEIKQIIQESAEHVSTGVERVGQTGEALERIIGNVVKVGDLISDVTQNTKEQSSRLDGIGGTINQLDSMTQANVSMVENTTKASSDLESVNGKLRAAVQRFGGADEAAPHHSDAKPEAA